MKIKIISAILACIMLVSLTSCVLHAPDNAPDETIKPSDAPENDVTEPEETEPEGAEPEEAEPEETGWQGPGKNPDMAPCYHSIWHDFDDETMTIKSLYKWNSVDGIIYDMKNEGFGYKENGEWVPVITQRAVVLDNGVEITSGMFYKTDGIKIRIYHNDELYGEYTVDSLLPSSEIILPNTYVNLYIEEKKASILDTSIEDFLSDPQLDNVEVSVFKDGIPVTEGSFENGMTIQLIAGEEKYDFTVELLK